MLNYFLFFSSTIVNYILNRCLEEGKKCDFNSTFCCESLQCYENTYCVKV